MEAFPLFQPRCLTVSYLTQLIKDLLESEEALQDVWIEGEVSNLSRPSSGHLYFTLKDGACALNCVIWRGNAQRLRTQPREGALIQAHGAIGVYEASGKYQLYVDLVRPAGEGELFRQFLLLKEKLEAEGLFAEERKRPIPPWPHCIGIVTSPTGAALQDMLNVLGRRYTMAEIILAPTSVQGPEAPLGIAAALQALNRLIHPDVILIARGGGSIEDLWAFNDERVVRAICASPVPVITGIGHETDYTLADFACDLRAPTPSGAAMLCVPDREELRQSLRERIFNLARSMESNLEDHRWELAEQHRRLTRVSPLGLIQNQRQRVDDYERGAAQALEHHLRLQRARLDGMAMRLLSLSPQSVLQRGYAMVTHLTQGGLVKSTRQVSQGDQLNVHVSDGQFTVQVTEKPERRNRDA
jgi:exodeoxyribonuclease VII large subunit